jgi:hypothetical protein
VPSPELLDLRAAARARRPEIGAPGSLGPAVIATWRGRMVNEHGSARVFEGIAAQLAALGRDEEAAACRRFAEEEREHGALCGAVVEAAGGEAIAPALVRRPVPSHADTTPRAAVIRNLISVSCLSETVAVALIGAERLEMPESPLRSLLERIWADEIGHARFGWRVVARDLAELDARERDAVAGYLPVALGHLEAHELAHLPAERRWPAEGRAFGLCDGPDARALFEDTVREVIVPGLEGLGLPAARAWDERRAR